MTADRGGVTQHYTTAGPAKPPRTVRERLKLAWRHAMPMVRRPIASRIYTYPDTVALRLRNPIPERDVEALRSRVEALGASLEEKLKRNSHTGHTSQKLSLNRHPPGWPKPGWQRPGP